MGIYFKIFFNLYLPLTNSLWQSRLSQYINQYNKCGGNQAKAEMARLEAILKN